VLSVGHTFKSIHNLSSALEQQAVNFLAVTQILDISALVDVFTQAKNMNIHFRRTHFLQLILTLRLWT
jgi:hypothetical protein